MRSPRRELDLLAWATSAVIRAEAEALRAVRRAAPAPRLLHYETGSIPVLFRDAKGSTTYDADGKLVYLPSPEELQEGPAGR